MQVILDFYSMIAPHVTTSSLVFARIGTICLFLPALGEASLSSRVKVCISLVFTTIVYLSKVEDPVFFENRSYVQVFASEIVVGLFIGLIFRLMVLGLQTAGTIAAQSTSLSQILGTTGVDPMPAMGHILVIGAICLAVTSGLHLKAAIFFLYSYDLFAMGDVFSGESVAIWGVDKVSVAFRLAFALAAPFVVLSLLYNIVLGVINKAMPQLMVAFVGAPFITFGGLFLLFATAPVILATWLSAFDAVLSDPR